MAQEITAAIDERIEELRTRLARVMDLRSAAAVLSWDQETYMPKGAAQARADQIATLRTVAHELFTSDEVGKLLEDLEGSFSDSDPSSFEASLVRVSRREFDKAVRLPSRLVSEIAEAVSLGLEAWKKARGADDFSIFAPHLERLIELNVEKAEAYGYTDRIYDALLDDYEPGMKTSEVERIFGELRPELTRIVERIANVPAPDDSILRRRFDRQKQWEFGVHVIRDFGFDFKHGRQDYSSHPFTTTFAITDVRITTRISENYLPTGLFGTLHEAGHALYEQGVAMELARTPLADGASLSVHESQSRLWENLVARSRVFWQHYYPKLQSIFSEELGSVKLEAFHRAINKVQPGLIRVEADEVTYNLHIMLRFELEMAVIDKTVSVNELPGLWNEKMREYLGVRPESDANGVLQDIHWALGAFGYFPTYSLGNLMSAQLFDQIRSDLPDLDERILEGDFVDLLEWLRLNIHRHGRKFEAPKLLRMVTGKELGAGSWLGYVKRKYSDLYAGAGLMGAP